MPLAAFRVFTPQYNFSTNFHHIIVHTLFAQEFGDDVTGIAPGYGTAVELNPGIGFRELVLVKFEQFVTDKVANAVDFRLSGIAFGFGAETPKVHQRSDRDVESTVRQYRKTQAFLNHFQHPWVFAQVERFRSALIEMTDGGIGRIGGKGGVEFIHFGLQLFLKVFGGFIGDVVAGAKCNAFVEEILFLLAGTQCDQSKDKE